MAKTNKKYQKYNCKKNLIFRLNIIFTAFWIVVCAAYLAALNDVTAKGYKMEKIESELLELKNENKKLTLNVSDKQSMEEVAAKIKNIDMIDAGSVIYLTMPQTAVVRK